MKNMNQTLTQWVIKLAEASGETISDDCCKKSLSVIKTDSTFT